MTIDDAGATRKNVAFTWRRLSWFLLQVVSVVVSFGAFFMAAPWLATQPISEATPDMLATLPENCQAFNVSHGQTYCATLGTVQSNPWGFMLCVTVLIGSIGLAAWIAITERGLTTLTPTKWLRSSTD